VKNKKKKKSMKREKKGKKRFFLLRASNAVKAAAMRMAWRGCASEGRRVGERKLNTHDFFAICGSRWLEKIR
jgi:hypothetical protein